MEDASSKPQGLFETDAVIRRVHGDFTSMMIGGVSALMLQMLHPGALAGVWDHSNFRHDMPGRLRRTAQFIGTTTYGSREDAERLIERVALIHRRVRGELPDGTPYSADDPRLLTWVHVAEVSSFLRAFLRYRDPLLSPRLQDRYLDESAEIARRLGAEDIPRSRREIAEYLREMRRELRFDERTREVQQALLSQPAASASALAPFQTLVFDAGIELLPHWGAQLHGFNFGPGRRAAIRAGAAGMGAVLRWGLDAPAPGAKVRPGRPAAGQPATDTSS
ncbi:oxygenase MpaB family protein [Terrihabitans rhizophilus]|uniref:Oxygenase MpaB family protein n=1 Tax=Terrihabitans rhizophilus TaxID=3092662 RepID=A0ABU4RP16_9HYPH|nr:oxygenase MpaB family protein [Terrihabitans sp. PJ23]MDX6805839.1 oxygenase MpaB family protein [Terrihabitans sp. PJ23]